MRTAKLDPHKDHVHCEHKKLKYCAKCDQPYCLDCGHAWNQYQWYSNAFGNGYTYTYYTNDNVPTTTVTTNCSHIGAN